MRISSALAVRLLAFAALVGVAAPARAEPALAVPPPAPPDAPDHFVDPTMRRTWSDGEPRAFVSTQIDAGYLYLRPRVSAGWGMPFHAWIGADANPVANANSAGGYAGVRAALPFVDLRVGARQLFSYQRRYITPASSIDAYALESTVNGHGHSLAGEAELDSAIPVGPGRLLALASASYVTQVPDGDWVYEEALRVVVAPPWVLRARVGYAIPIPGLRSFTAAPVVDALWVPERDARLARSASLRAGVILRAVLSRHLEVRGVFVPTVRSPDTIGLAGGDFTELGLRYRWATGATP